MAELEIPELPGRPLLEERVKDYPKVQWLLDKYLGCLANARKRNCCGAIVLKWNVSPT